MAEHHEPESEDLADDVEVEHEPTVTYVPVSEDAISILTPAQASAIAGIEGFALIVQRGPQTGKTWLLPEGQTSIGRDPSNDIVLDDITVSRHHCDIDLTDHQLGIHDAGSTNGTYINDRRADERRLEPGDRLLVGKFHLVVAHGDG